MRREEETRLKREWCRREVCRCVEMVHRGALLLEKSCHPLGCGSTYGVDGLARYYCASSTTQGVVQNVCHGVDNLLEVQKATKGKCVGRTAQHSKTHRM
jgi:hypothetical protein